MATRTNEMLTGVILGYDPGGNGAHGVAKLTVRSGQPSSLVTSTLQTVEEVINYMADMSNIAAIGVDTLTCWCTGLSAWRPADRWLRDRYGKVRSSIVSPNGLRGSMVLNGMTVLMQARLKFPGLPITETHPKILYWHLSNQKYGYTSSKVAMNKTLSHALGIDVSPTTEHEWDAALSTLAALRGVTRCWMLDLHGLPTGIDEQIISPCGRTNYFWPE
ncbi:MAG: hypothetical protein ACOYOS_20390 [Syntrophales bacterium]